MSQLKTIDLTTMSQFTQVGVRALDYHVETQKLLIGTRGSEILEVNLQTGEKIKTHISGHFHCIRDLKQPYSEVWGCTVHPTK